MKFPESDWKKLKKLHASALNSACETILTQSSIIVNDTSLSAYDRYIKLHEHIKKANDKIAMCFNDMKRSRIPDILIRMRREDIIEDKDLDIFSDELRQKVRFILAY
ncbi:MAG: hypothetical protein GY795_04730 [Desulfobacterales bacterium]|nr:hypothetical protein [Desulfobacterales bacterium]